MLSTIRHKEIFDPRANNHPITIIGAGAVGSRIFATLVELGLTNISVYDFDEVEHHNLANQLYGASDIGSPKVTALMRWALSKTGVSNLPPEMQFFIHKVSPGDQIKGTVFLLVDSMAERRKLYNGCIKGNLDVPRVIECRMAATHGDIYHFDHSSANQWLSTLIDDDKAEVSGCGSAFSVAPTAAIISNLAVWQFIHAKTNPEALDPIIHVFLKPLIVATESWSNSHAQAA